MPRLLGFLKPHARLVIGLVLVNVLLSAMLTVAPLVTKAIVDDVIGSQQLQLLLPYLGLLLAVTGLRATATYFYTYGQNKLGQLVMTDVRYALYRKLLALQFGFYDKEQTGRLMSRVSSDVESTRLFLSQILVESMSHIFTIILATSALFQQNSLLAIIGLVPMIASGLAMYLSHRKLRLPWSKQHERLARMSSTLQDSLSGIKVVQAFAQEAQEARKFMAAAMAVRHGNQTISDMWNKRWAVIGSLGRFMQLMLIGVGGMLVMNGALSLGSLVAAISLSILLIGAINALGQQLNSFSQTATAAVRIFELLDEPVTIRTPAPIPTLLPTLPTQASVASPAQITGDIEFRNVSFAYPTSKANNLRGINLHVPAGSSLAIVGATGAGKSTLINLIGRFYDPTSGQVLIDGHDVRSMDLSTLRHQIGMVAQDTLLFSATLAENIAFGQPDASQADIERAAKLAQAHDFILKLEDGYQTKIGERGTGLSGGQRQRIAIARAILLNPRILILDDSMSAVDAQTERLLQTAIRGVMQGRTTILIAHRLSTVQQADHIIVLRDGTLVEQGTHAQLARASGYYQQVLDRQQMTGDETLGEPLNAPPNIPPAILGNV